MWDNAGLSVGEVVSSQLAVFVLIGGPGRCFPAAHADTARAGTAQARSRRSSATASAVARLSHDLGPQPGQRVHRFTVRRDAAAVLARMADVRDRGLIAAGRL